MKTNIVSLPLFDLCKADLQYGTFFLTRAAVPHIPKGGSIIVTASQGTLFSIRIIDLSLIISRIRWTPIPPRLLHDQGRSGRHGPSTLQPAHFQGYPSQVS